MRLAIVLLAILGGCGAQADSAHLDAVRDRQAAQIIRSIRVIDGDTIDMAGERVRIENIDAPEMPEHATCWAEARLALETKERLSQIIANSVHDPLHLVRDTKRPKDRYGRTLARLVAGNVDLGQILIDEGLAVPWTGHRWSWCQKPDEEEAGANLVRDHEARDRTVRTEGLSVTDLATRARLTGLVGP